MRFKTAVRKFYVREGPEKATAYLQAKDVGQSTAKSVSFAVINSVIWGSTTSGPDQLVSNYIYIRTCKT